MQDTFTSSRTTLIRYRDPMGAIDWLEKAFQFEPRFVARRTDGSFAYAHLALGEQQITVTARDERSLGPAAGETQQRTVTVADIAAHFARAKAAGAEIVRGIDGGEDNGRSFVCRDVEGHTWSFSDTEPHGLATFLAWARVRTPRVEKRAGLAAAAVLSLMALSYPAWHLLSRTGEAPPDAATAGDAAPAQTADVPSGPAPEIIEDQVLEHARFALAEEQAARLAAEASRRVALAELAQERAARLEAEKDAHRFEAELSAARATRAEAESLVQNLDGEASWDTQIAHASASESPVAPSPGEIVLSVAPPPPGAPAEPAHPASAPPKGGVLAEGQGALARGDVEEARRIFRRLADEGVAQAALALGSTYDPVNAERTGMAHAQLDREQAKQWYRRAIELAQAATERQRKP